MARHALRAKSFFRHPDIVGSQYVDHSGAAVLRAVENVLAFDAFVRDLMGWHALRGKTGGMSFKAEVVSRSSNQSTSSELYCELTVKVHDIVFEI